MPGTAKYKMGRDCVAELPGVENDDIKDVTINAAAEELDITVFKAQPIDKAVYAAGLVDLTIEVSCTKHTATVGQHGAQGVAGIDTAFEAIVLDVVEKATPKGVVEYTVTYGLQMPDSGS